MLYKMCFVAPFPMSLSEHLLVQFDLDCQYLGDNFSRCLLNFDEGSRSFFSQLYATVHMWRMCAISEI